MTSHSTPDYAPDSSLLERVNEERRRLKETAEFVAIKFGPSRELAICLADMYRSSLHKGRLEGRANSVETLTSLIGGLDEARITGKILPTQREEMETFCAGLNSTLQDVIVGDVDGMERRDIEHYRTLASEVIRSHFREASSR